MRIIHKFVVPGISYLTLFVASVIPLCAQTASDVDQIKQAALDYMEGWYEGNAQRMERSLHPELAKRIVTTNANGRNSLEQMGAMTLVQSTRQGRGKVDPSMHPQKDVAIFDVFGNVASVRATMADWIDYMHMAKWNGRWVIVNVLWEKKPPK